MVNGVPETPKDWQKAAGLAQEPEPKKLDKLFKYLPTWSDIGTGVFFIFMGLTAWTGGGMGIRTAADVEPIWITLEHIPEWIAGVLIWIGVDALFLKGKGTPWFWRKIGMPVAETILKATAGEERMARWEEKMDRWFTTKDEEEQE